MYINPISMAYWRMIKGGFRTFDSVLGNDIRSQVEYLAKEDVKRKIITPEEFYALLNKEYQE